MTHKISLDGGGTHDTDIQTSTHQRVRDRRGRLRSSHTTLRITRSASEQLGNALEDCAAGFHDGEQLSLQARRTLNALLNRVLPNVARTSASLGRLDGPSSLYVEGLPVMPNIEHTKLLALCLAGATGRPFQYTSQNDGQVCAVLRPRPDAPPNSNASPLEFKPHSDDPNIPLALRVENITLTGQTNTAAVPTGYAAVDSIVEYLSAAQVRQLRASEYEFSAPASFNQESERWTAARPVLMVRSNGEQIIQYQSEGLRAKTQAGQDALDALAKAAQQAMQWFVVGPMTALQFSNQGGLHSRKSIDGEREVVRIYTRQDLRALQKTCESAGPVFDVKMAI